MPYKISPSENRSQKYTGGMPTAGTNPGETLKNNHRAHALPAASQPHRQQDEDGINGSAQREHNKPGPGSAAPGQ
jgi:hypothetical protein